MRVHTGSQSLARPWRPVAWLALVAFMLNPLLVVAQTANSSAALLSPGDHLKLTVPGRPELDQELVLDDSGQVTIEPVGALELGGISVDEASLLLKQKLRLFYPTLDALELELVATGGVQIYVMGSVDQKGVLNYEVAPTLWDLVRSFGGPMDGANLREARVIREVDGQPKVYPVDLSGMMDGKGVPDFLMEDGDTLIIPALQDGIPGVKAHDGVKVFGSVGVPTIVPIVEGTPMMDVLMLAGAPTVLAEKTKVYWVHNDGVRNKAEIVNLELFLLEGDDLGNPLVYPGDTISVEYKKPSWVRANVPFILGSLAAMATIYLAYDNIVYRDR